MPKIAIVGVEQGIGKEVLNLLAEHGYNHKDIVALELRSALGNMVSFGEDDELDVVSLDGFDFKTIKIAVFATGAEIARKYIPSALKAGAKVIDATGSSIGNPDVPMILYGHNEDKINLATKGIVAVPSAEVSQMLIPLQNLHRQYHISRIVVSTYSSAGTAGRAGMDELFNQTRKIFMNETLADEQSVFHKQVAFNVIPHVGEFMGEETSSEWAFNAESKQILGQDVKVHANCAIIPAFVGCAQFINVEFAKEIDVADAKREFKQTPQVVVFDKQTDGGYVTLHDVQGENDIYISRLRQDTSVENGISFWCVADALRAAAAYNIFALIKSMSH